MKSKIVAIFSKCKLDFAHLSAYAANGAKISSREFYSVYELIKNIFLQILQLKVLLTFYRTWGGKL